MRNAVRQGMPARDDSISVGAGGPVSLRPSAMSVSHSVMQTWIRLPVDEYGVVDNNSWLLRW